MGTCSFIKSTRSDKSDKFVPTLPFLGEPSLRAPSVPVIRYPCFFVSPPTPALGWRGYPSSKQAMKPGISSRVVSGYVYGYACQIPAPHGAKQPVGMVADLTRSCWRRGRGRIEVLSFDAVDVMSSVPPDNPLPSDPGSTKDRPKPYAWSGMVRQAGVGQVVASSGRWCRVTRKMSGIA